MQISIPFAGDDNKSLTGKIALRSKGGVELVNKMIFMPEKQQLFLKVRF